MILAAVELAAPGIQLVLRCSQAASHPHTLEGEGAAVGLFGHGSFEKAECIYMTNEELTSMIQSGERGKVLELWEQVRRFACQQGKKWAAYHGHGMEIEDYAQVGFLAMLDALGSWKRAGGSFITWYAMRLKAAFTASSGQRTQRDRMDPLQTSMSLEMPLQDGEGKQISLADVIPDKSAERDMEQVVERDFAERRRAAVRQALVGLPEDQRRAVILRYWAGKPVDPKIHREALRALRRPAVSRGLRQYL